MGRVPQGKGGTVNCAAEVLEELNSCYAFVSYQIFRDDNACHGLHDTGLHDLAGTMDNVGHHVGYHDGLTSSDTALLSDMS
jgi:hypothetical protein